jgi:hypothetical protein
VTDLVEQLARLGEDEFRDVIREARAERGRRVQIAIRQVRKTLLPGFSDRKAARAIDDAVCDRRTGLDPALRGAIAQQLRGALGHLDDLPGAERIRQLFDK